MNPASTEASQVYTTRIGDCVQDRDTVVAIWQGNLGQPARHAPKYDWFYLGCPWGQPLLALLRHEPSATWIGTCAAGPRRMLWQGREIRAGVLVDMAVTQRHRSLGPALIMQSALIAAAASRFEMIYGFPNPKSLAVAKRLEYTVACDLVRYSYVLRYRRYLERIMLPPIARPLAWVLDAIGRFRHLPLYRIRKAGVRANWQDCADSRMDALWQKSPRGDGPITVRDVAFLIWRFEGFDAARTRYLVLCAPRDPETLLAWFACQVLDDTLHVRDFWSDLGATGLASSHIDALVRASRQIGCRAISIEYAGSPHTVAALLACGFHERSRRPVIIRWSSVAQGSGARTFQHLTAADEDE